MNLPPSMKHEVGTAFQGSDERKQVLVYHALLGLLRYEPALWLQTRRKRRVV
jgi:hypothetical protein